MTTATTPPRRIAYIGNFEPEHSTENHVRLALERTGHQVVPLQENHAQTWTILRTPYMLNDLGVQLVLWTRTGWDWPAATGWTHDEAVDVQLSALDTCRNAGLGVVGFHLDRWWGLAREGQVLDEPFFTADLVCTADGGHARAWVDAGVNHRWMPPGVLLAECERQPRVRSEYRRHDVVFVGSWQSYHPEWIEQRRAVVLSLRRRYGRRLGLYPRAGRSVRGPELTDLYDNAKVVVGDSCLAGGQVNYWSDRVPETIGRRGFLIHPDVDGMGDYFTDGEHLVTYPLGDIGKLHHLIGHYLTHPEERDRIRMAGHEHVKREHTYERRMDQLLQLATEEGLL